MKKVRKHLLFCIIPLFVGCAQPSSGDLPLIDLTKEYPKKDIVLQEIADVEYVSLNGKDAPLIGRPRIGYVSQEVLVLYDVFTGDVFVLDRDGNCLSHFNNQGNSGKEYVYISHLTYDPQKREIYVLDASGANGILVYTDRGAFVRSFPEQSQQYLREIYNFDDQTLLAYCMPARMDSNNPNHTNPYLFLSKQDGKIVSRLDFRFQDDRITSRKIIPTDAGPMAIVITGDNSLKFGGDFVVADISADTLYLLSKGAALTPVLSRMPSVYDQEIPIVWSVGLKTDQFILIRTAEYDFEAIKKAALNNQPTPRIKSGQYLFYTENHEVVTPKFINTDWPSVSVHFTMDRVSMEEKNMSATILYAEQLTGALEKEKLQGNLKELALTLAPDDNPVLMLIKYK